MRTAVAVAAMVSVVALAGGSVYADVMNMSGLTSLEFVDVGNPGNAPDNTGYGSVSYAFKMGKYEVTAGQYTEFLNAVAATDTYALYNSQMLSNAQGCQIVQTGSDGSYVYTVAADWANRPVNYASWGDAARFANWMTNGQPTGAQDLNSTEDGSYYLNGATSNADLMGVLRKPTAKYVLSTANEWYKAAYYDGLSDVYYEYPTGSDNEPSNALLGPDPGNNSNFRTGVSPTYVYTIDAPYYRTEVGDFENSGSPYGTFDQGGNAFEWTEENSISGTARVFRGGCYGWGGVFYQTASVPQANLDVESPMNAFSSSAFRIAEVPAPIPEPGTMLLIGTGLAGLARLARRRRT